MINKIHYFGDSHTKGIWDDAHTTNEFNEELANKIFNMISYDK